MLDKNSTNNKKCGQLTWNTLLWSESAAAARRLDRRARLRRSHTMTRVTMGSVGWRERLWKCLQGERVWLNVRATTQRHDLKKGRVVLGA